MKLLIASNNKHKVSEIKAILKDYFDEIVTLQDAGIDVDVVEDGDTFAENAAKKAHEILAISGAEAVLADDSGLMVDALDGAPGVYSARFAGSGHDDLANNEKLLLSMKDVPREKRGCRFTTSVVLSRAGKKDLVADGFVEGILLNAPLGDNGFGYDPLFFYEPFQKSFAQLSSDEKNGVSHRKRALSALCELLNKERGEQ